MHPTAKDIYGFIQGSHDYLMIPVNGLTEPGIEQFLEHVSNNQERLKRTS